MNLIVPQYTDCGITRLGGHPELLATAFGIDQVDLEARRTPAGSWSVGEPVAKLHHLRDTGSGEHGSAEMTYGVGKPVTGL